MRKSISDQIYETFQPHTPLVVHFDSKILPDTDGKKNDRMAVVVTGKDIEKLLSIPTLRSGTEVVMGTKVVEILNEWQAVPEWVSGLCFDTTNVNSGVHTGAITVIQKSVNKHLLFLACRHHMFEIVATAVFDMFFATSGPQIALFSRFKDNWSNIDQSNFASFEKDTVDCVLSGSEQQWLNENRSCVLSFLRSQIGGEKQPRSDYLELLKLSLVTLGEAHLRDDDFKFNAPGAYHRARWMARGIYCLKIFLFRKQFVMSAHELQALKRISLFTVTLYVQAWFNASNSCDAPFNDLCLLQRIESYAAVDSEISQVALKKLRGHLWYLSEDLISLAFFSDKVSTEEKKSMVVALTKPGQPRNIRRVDSKLIQSSQATTLSDYVTKSSENLFSSLKIDSTFLDSDPSTWSSRQDYMSSREIVCALRVVNDCAERLLNW